MNASLSYDPVIGLGDHSGMNFTWHYGEIKGNYSGLRTPASDFFTGVNQSNIRYTGNDSGLEVTFSTAPMSINKTYLVKLVVTKDYRSSSVYQIIHLVKGDPPEISQRLGINFTFSDCFFFLMKARENRDKRDIPRSVYLICKVILLKLF